MTDILRRTRTTAGTVIVEMSGLRWWVKIESDFLSGNQCFDDIEAAGKYYSHVAKKLKVIEVINNYTTELESHSYFGSSLGVPTTHYDDIAEELLDGIYI